MHRLRIAVVAAICLFSVVVAAHAQSAIVNGHVMDAQSMPVSAAVVTLTGSDSRPRATRTAPDGAFAITDLPAGRRSASSGTTKARGFTTPGTGHCSAPGRRRSPPADRLRR